MTPNTNIALLKCVLDALMEHLRPSTNLKRQRNALNPGSSPSFVSLDKNVFCKVQHIIRQGDVTKPPRLLKRLPQCHNMMRNKRCTSQLLSFS